MEGLISGVLRYVDRRVTHQSGLPHLPGVPHLHVNRPLDFSFFVLNILAD